jgi:hypothetical protein
MFLVDAIALNHYREQRPPGASIDLPDDASGRRSEADGRVLSVREQ